MSSYLSPRLRHTSSRLSGALWRTSHYSVSCKQIISHHSVIRGWGDFMIQTQSVYAHALMGIPPAGSLTDVYLRTAHAANRLLPISHCPTTWSRKRLCRRTFFTLWAAFSWQIGIAWAAVHHSYSHMALSAVVSFNSRGQMVLCEACSED